MIQHSVWTEGESELRVTHSADFNRHVLSQGEQLQLAAVIRANYPKHLLLVC